MNIPARFEAKIVRVPFCGCWIWTGSGEQTRKIVKEIAWKS